MAFEFILPGAARKNSDDSLIIKKSILNLKNQLISIGYNPGEVDYLVKKFGNSKGLNELGPEELQELKKALQAQLDIARKCIGAV